MNDMSCARAAELLSDDIEGTLDGVLAADLGAHLEACAECRALRVAVADVTALLRVPDVEPATDLGARVARASFAAKRKPSLRARRPRAWAVAAGPWLGWLGEVPFVVQAVSAGFALVLTAGFVVAASGAPPGGPARAGMRERLSETAVHLVERKDRMVEDLRLLRVVIATAFEGRLDRVNDRVDDYRRLLERRRQEEQARDHKKSQVSVGALRWADGGAARTRGGGNI